MDLRSTCLTIDFFSISNWLWVIWLNYGTSHTKCNRWSGGHRWQPLPSCWMRTWWCRPCQHPRWRRRGSQRRTWKTSNRKCGECSISLQKQRTLQTKESQRRRGQYLAEVYATNDVLVLVRAKALTCDCIPHFARKVVASSRNDGSVLVHAATGQSALGMREGEG